MRSIFEKVIYLLSLSTLCKCITETSKYLFIYSSFLGIFNLTEILIIDFMKSKK